MGKECLILWSGISFCNSSWVSFLEISAFGFLIYWLQNREHVKEHFGEDKAEKKQLEKHPESADLCVRQWLSMQGQSRNCAVCPSREAADDSSTPPWSHDSSLSGHAGLISIHPQTHTHTPHWQDFSQGRQPRSPAVPTITQPHTYTHTGPWRPAEFQTSLRIPKDRMLAIALQLSNYGSVAKQNSAAQHLSPHATNSD